jgi:hypothetical protein
MTMINWSIFKTPNKSVSQTEFGKLGFTVDRNDIQRRKLFTEYNKGKAINDIRVAEVRELLNNTPKTIIPDRECAEYIIKNKRTKRNDEISSCLKKHKYDDASINDFLVKYEISSYKDDKFICARVDIACQIIKDKFNGDINEKEGYVTTILLDRTTKIVPIVTFNEGKLSQVYSTHKDASFILFTDQECRVDNNTVTISKMFEDKIVFL